MREVVIVGEEGLGKTTLANALLGWDVFPQSDWDLYIPTEKNASQMLTAKIRLTDTPGYDLWWQKMPESVVEAISKADTVIVLLEREEDTKDPDEAFEDEPQWKERQQAEEKLQKDLLEQARTRDIYFVIPYDSAGWQEEPVPKAQWLRLARARYGSMTEHGEAGFFCVDPVKALVGEIEADAAAIADSGIVPLKEALLG